jgi:hypothetical protein
MSTVKDFASKDLTPSCQSPPLTPESDENYFEMAGDVRFKFAFSLTSPIRRVRRWIAKALEL